MEGCRCIKQKNCWMIFSGDGKTELKTEYLLFMKKSIENWFAVWITADFERTNVPVTYTDSTTLQMLIKTLIAASYNTAKNPHFVPFYLPCEQYSDWLGQDVLKSLWKKVLHSKICMKYQSKKDLLLIESSTSSVKSVIGT